jgi:hypothetical protein
MKTDQLKDVGFVVDRQDGGTHGGQDDASLQRSGGGQVTTAQNIACAARAAGKALTLNKCQPVRESNDSKGRGATATHRFFSSRMTVLMALS